MVIWNSYLGVFYFNAITHGSKEWLIINKPQFTVFIIVWKQHLKKGLKENILQLMKYQMQIIHTKEFRKKTLLHKK